MKMLVVGMDGADAELIKNLEMPFLQSLLQGQSTPELKEDLWSRGWAEIVSGAHARETGAFYYRPAKMGTHDFTQSYRLGDFNNANTADLIWDSLNLRKVSAGFMNIPTTFPAPDVEGFFVSGAGSGLGGSGSAAVPHGAVTPKQIASLLEAESYVFDLRLQTSNILDLSEFVLKQIEMTEKRTTCFIEACNSTPPQFGFIAYMMTKYLFNLGMSEIQAYINNGHMAANTAQSQLIRAFSALDRCVQELFDALKPERYMLVSDHGTVPYLHRIDMNVFLRNAGFQPSMPASASIANRLRRIARATLPKSIRGSLNQRVPKSVSAQIASHGVDLNRAEAFSARYVPGVYVNDERFGGPVDGLKTASIVDRVCTSFNAHPDAFQHGLMARPYRSAYPGAQFSWMLPDVWIDHPDTIFFEHGIGEGNSSGGRFIYPNPAYGPIPPLREVTRDLWTGIKGSTPLFVVDQETAKLIRSDDPSDLTLAHRLIERSFA